MKAFNKIGFHTSVGGNPTGIGDWMKALDAADIPFFVKAADAMTGLFDAQQIVHARNGAVPHVLAYRGRMSSGTIYEGELVPNSMHKKRPAEAGLVC